jgi:hypothetical protein
MGGRSPPETQTRDAQTTAAELGMRSLSAATTAFARRLNGDVGDGEPR